MKTIILAAGYATRLYPLTKTLPKPLLNIAGKPILEHLFFTLNKIKDIDSVYIVTNEKFHGHFKDWHGSFPGFAPHFSVTLVNDGTMDEAGKLGAIGDMFYVVKNRNIDDDVLVVAGDNMFSDTFEKFVETGKAKNAPILGTFDVEDFEIAKKMSVFEIDSEGKLTQFEEKPQNPKTTMIGIALYYFPKDILKMLGQYVEDGNNPDQPGRFIEWLYKRTPVYTWMVPGVWFDVGSHESLAAADDFFKRKVKQLIC